MKLYLQAMLILAVFYFPGVARSSSEHSYKETEHVGAKKNSAKPIEYPEFCLKNRLLPCALKGQQKRTSLQLDDVKVVLSKSASIVWLSDSSFQVISGDVWIQQDQAGDHVLIKTEYGSLRSSGDLNVFLRKSEYALEIYPIFNEVRVYPLGLSDQKGLLLPAGYRSQLSAVNESGVAQYEIPVATNLKGFIEAWAPLFDGAPMDLTANLRKFKNLWLNAVHDGGDWQMDLAQREIASEKKRQEHLADLRRKRLEEEKYLRKLFRQKNYLE